MAETNGHATEEAVKAARKRLTANEILVANDIQEEEIDVPEWGGTVMIRGFTKERQQELRQMATDPKTQQVDAQRLEMQIFIYGVIDPEFAPIQATELRKKSAGVLDRIIKRIMDISGMTSEAVAEAQKSDEERS